MTLWVKYMGQEISMDTIYKDDFLPLVKENRDNGLPVDDSVFSAILSISCQMPHHMTVPLSWISRATREFQEELLK